MSKKPDFDVLIMGAGLSGIDAACHLKMNCPDKTYQVLERRADLGGTWDLFKYPGIRSDSDMSTFGFSFRPWNGDSVLADGHEIKTYLKETADEYGVTDKIRFRSKVTKANWSSSDQLWSVTFTDETDNTEHTATAQYVIVASGYYNHDEGYQPDFPGMKSFKGEWIHPQFWPEDLKLEGKNVVVIGSGATAVTLIPSLVGEGAHATMLQRSPTYVASVPSKDPISEKLRGKVSDKIIYKMSRARNIALQRSIYELSRHAPKMMKKLFLGMVDKQLNDKVDIKHFTPSYNPWDQRLCAVPGGDLFKVLRQGKADVVTDEIDKVTANGITLKSGKKLDADVIVSATGLKLLLGGGVTITMDGEPVKLTDRLTYKGVLLSGIPNAAVIFGYTNSSWTLKADIACSYFTRVINYMDKTGKRVVVPNSAGVSIGEGNIFGALDSGYIRRGKDMLPQQGKSGVWRVTHNFFTDYKVLEKKPIKDEFLEFSA